MKPKPPKSITDPTFHYTSAAATDLRKTFARIRRQMKAAKAEADKPAAVANVAPLEMRRRVR